MEVAIVISVGWLTLDERLRLLVNIRAAFIPTARLAVLLHRLDSSLRAVGRGSHARAINMSGASLPGSLCRSHHWPALARNVRHTGQHCLRAACSTIRAAHSRPQWLPCFQASGMVWDIRDLLLTEAGVPHAGLLPCDCMLSGRRGPCNPSCYRAKIGTLLSAGRWKKLGDFVRRLRTTGQLL